MLYFPYFLVIVVKKRSMEQNRIDKLLADYLADTISEKDFLEMRSRVNQMTDDELATILHKAWMENKVSKEIFKAKAVLLIPRIKKELSHPTNTPLSIKEKHLAFGHLL